MHKKNTSKDCDNRDNNNNNNNRCNKPEKKVGRAAHFFVNLLAVNSRGLRPGSIVCSEHMID